MQVSRDDINEASLALLLRFQKLIAEWSATEEQLSKSPERDDQAVRTAFAQELASLIDLLDDLGLKVPSAIEDVITALANVSQGIPAALLMPDHSAKQLKLGDNPGEVRTQFLKSYAAATRDRLISQGVPIMKAAKLVADAVSTRKKTVSQSTVRSWKVLKLAKRADAIPSDVTGEEMLENLKKMHRS